MNKQVLGNLDLIITSLETDPQSTAEGTTGAS
jgi:hypothetical protein